MSTEDWKNMGLDDGVIPMVDFFNNNGLTTYMSCQGHNMPNMSIFWIEFDKTVTEEDILKFMQKHVSAYGHFCSCGRFAKRLIGFHAIPSGEYRKEESWNYFAASVEAANKDLETWKNDKGIWKGINGQEFQECREIYYSKRAKMNGK